MKRFAVGACFASTLGIAAAYGSAFLRGGAPALAVPLMIVCIATLMIAVSVLGALRGGSLGRLAAPMVFAWVVLVGGFLLALWLPAESVASPMLWLGLPRRAAIVLYGVGLVPLIAMPIAYALTFDDATLSEEDLAALRTTAAEIIARESAS